MLALISCCCLTARGQKFTIDEHKEQLWLQYFNQTKINDRWGVWLDIGIRSEDYYTRGVSTVLGRVGLIRQLGKSIRLTAGYAFFSQRPAYNVIGIAQPEHRFWQMVQYQQDKGKSQFVHAVRLEQRFRRKFASPTERSDEYRFNYRLRYSFSWQYPLRNARLEKGDLSIILLDEIMLNFGKQVIYDNIDQNRAMAGLRYYFNKDNNVMVAYLNIFQKKPEPELVRISNNIRISYFQTLHL
jgi:hypothetical protein